MTFTATGLWTSANTQELYNFSDWLLGQAAPILMMLFAAFIVYLLIRQVRSTFLGSRDNAVNYDLDDEDEDDDY